MCNFSLSFYFNGGVYSLLSLRGSSSCTTSVLLPLWTGRLDRQQGSTIHSRALRLCHSHSAPLLRLRPPLFCLPTAIDDPPQGKVNGRTRHPSLYTLFLSFLGFAYWWKEYWIVPLCNSQSFSLFLCCLPSAQSCLFLLGCPHLHGLLLFLFSRAVANLSNSESFSLFLCCLPSSALPISSLTSLACNLSTAKKTPICSAKKTPICSSKKTPLCHLFLFPVLL